MSALSKPGDDVLVVDDVAKTFSLGFRRKRVDAVRGVSFTVRRGEIFGLIGPNGAGKTTTIKMMMGLIRPSRGRIEIFGERAPRVASRARVGYLPEISYYYDYLKPEEILDFYGRLAGLDRRTCRKRVPELLDRVGLAKSIGKPLRKFSKGMLQRVGLAQAIISDPDLVVLDEPKSGLDPLGRKDVADLIVELRDAGKTIFFSSHILSDVERICDRVCVLVNGKVVDIGPLSELLNPRTLLTEVAVRGLGAAGADELAATFPNVTVQADDAGHTIVVPGDHSDDVQGLIRHLAAAEVTIDKVAPRREHLEDVFVREALHGAAGPAHTSSHLVADTATERTDGAEEAAPRTGEAHLQQTNVPDDDEEDG